MHSRSYTLSFFSLLGIVIGAVISTGIFVTPAIVADALYSPALIMLAWLIGGVVAVSGALTISELSSIAPNANGMVGYLSLGIGRPAGFLYGWSYLSIINSGGIAGICVASSSLLILQTGLSNEWIAPIAILLLGIVTLVNVLGLKPANISALFCTGIKVILLVGIISLGFLYGSSSVPILDFRLQEIPDDLPAGFTIALIAIFWTYGGFQHATFVLREARNSTKDLPVALMTGILIIVALYILTNIAYHISLTPDEIIGAKENVALSMFTYLFGPFWAFVLSFAIILAMVGSALIFSLTAPRMYRDMAKEGLLFPALAREHDRWGTPIYAIALQAGWSLLIIITWGTFEKVITYVVFADWMFFFLIAVALFVIRRRSSDEARLPAARFTVAPIIFMLSSLWIVVTAYQLRPLESVSGMVVILFGIPLYLIKEYLEKRKLSKSGGR